MSAGVRLKSVAHDGNHNPNSCSNQNQAWDVSDLCPLNLQSRSGRAGPSHDAPVASKTNHNLLGRAAPISCGHDIISGRGCSSSSQSDEEMWTSEDSSPASSPRPPLLPTPTTVKLRRSVLTNQEQEAEPEETRPPRVNMAAVAPFSYRPQVQNCSIFSLDELSDCSSGSIEVCCDDLTPGEMLEANVANISMTAQPRTSTSSRTSTSTSSAVSSPDRSDLQTMASRKPPPKPSALPQGLPRPSTSASSGSELKVYRPSSGSIPIPVQNPSGLKKQRSLNNLSVLTDAEKKLHLYQSSRTTAGQTKTGQTGRPTLCRTLSKSEQSLFHEKPKPGKQSRIPAPGKPRGPYAEVKPISKTSSLLDQTRTDSNPEDQLTKTCAAGNSGNKPGEKVRSASVSTEERKAMQEDQNFLKVDPELVVTVLGDLEQLLFSQMIDPESQRKRTVQNVLDLRQNLEETMSSLRGAQLSHSCLDKNSGYDVDDAVAFSSPMSWRQGQSSPRLQAGDAPSSGTTHSHILPLKIGHSSHVRLIEDLDDTDATLLKDGFLSDSDIDIGGKSQDEDDEENDEDLGNGWDESSSISSGLSDGSDNLSSEEFNTSPTLHSLPSTPVGTRHNSTTVPMRTDAEKSSLVENGHLSWDQKNLLYQTGSPKMDSTNQWKRGRPQGEGLEGGGRGELRKPQTRSQRNLVKKEGNAPVGVTPPIAPCPQRVTGSIKPGVKPVDKSRLAVKSSGLQRSSSDAGKEHRNSTGAADQRKPPSGLVRPTTGNFGFKKPTTAAGTGTVTGTGTSGSVTMGKIPKTSGIPVKPAAGGAASTGRKISLDVSSCCDQSGFLSPNARTSLQYRSLPRPAKTSTLTLTRPSSARPVSTTTDTCSGLTKPSTTAAPQLQGSRIGSGTGLSKAGGRGLSSPIPVNLTDREKEKERAKAKAVMSDSSSLASEDGTKLQGLRPPSGGRGNAHRLSTPSLLKPASTVQSDQFNSSSLDREVQDLQPLKILPFPKVQDRVSSSSRSGLTPVSRSEPQRDLGQRQVSSLGTVESTRGSCSPVLYPRLSGLHRSMESLPLPMSLAPEPLEKNRELLHGGKERQEGSGSAGVPFMGVQKGEREEVKERGERRHSHSVFTGSDSLTLPLLNTPTSLPRTTRTANAASSPVGGALKMTRSNSIPIHEASVESLAESPLSERPRSIGMIRSGSFRDADEVHGSLLSLVSNTSSTYSSAEDRIQGEQIRKLRRELESSQDKVSALTSQLTTNANLVAAFEQSLTLMTTRLQTLSVSHEQKDSELQDLRETIEALKSRNEEAQAVIHGALNQQENMKELQMRRQNSCESLSSLNSLSSMSSVGSWKEHEAKKKKKKSWLRSSFNKAFSMKKASKTYSDIEEISTPDSSAPNSPKMLHEGGEGVVSCQAPPLRKSASTNSLIEVPTEEGDAEESAVSDLRSELWEKERALTDIRLEALTSAHQLEQLRDAMNNMQSMVENLKAENNHLKTGSQPCCPTSSPASDPTSGPASSTSQPAGLASLVEPISMKLSRSFSLSLDHSREDPELSEMAELVDLQGLVSSQEDICSRVLVQGDQAEAFKGEQEFYLGSVLLSTRTDWTGLDSLIQKVFKDYLAQVDPTASLGLSCDSLLCYQLPHGAQRLIGGDKPQAQPLCCLSGRSPSVYVTLKGLKENCLDSLVFETLIPKPLMQHYISLLLKHRRLVLSGPSGTGKTFLAQRLAQYLLQRNRFDAQVNQEAEPQGSMGGAVTFNLHRQTQKELQLYLTNVANHIDRDAGAGELPLVVIIDDISDPAAVTELVNAALTCKYHRCPYIIGTTNQLVKMTSNHGLHQSFRMMMFSNNVEPANGFLLRYLHRKATEAQLDSSKHQELLRVLDWVPQLWYHLHTFLEKHSTSDFLIGPCFFLSCPATLSEFRPWFIDLWNHSIIPYLQEGANEGIKVHGPRAVWEDPVDWVRGTLPWPNAQQDQAKLFHLPPPSVSAPCCQEKTKLHSDTAPPLDSDPLMAMLLKLQESANHLESPERDGTDPALQTTL